jgi:hypothetical protein
VQANGELVLQLVAFEQAKANASSAVLPYGSEFEQCGIASIAADCTGRRRGGGSFDRRVVQIQTYPPAAELPP